MKWAVGVTTIPEREKMLERTLKSIEGAGFAVDRLFVDGDCDPRDRAMNGHRVTVHKPKISIVGNWLLGMMELYLREPHADRYAMLQDDVLLCKNLRQYLESCEYLHQSYLNLYTMPQNLLLSGGKQGWYASNQLGRGALALVFSREALVTLLQADHTFRKPQDHKNGHRSIDGCVLTGMKQRGWKEYVHNPSLVQHAGQGQSTLQNRDWPEADSFPGEDFDAMSLQQKVLA